MGNLEGLAVCLKYDFHEAFDMKAPVKLPDKFKDIVAAMPEYSYGVQRVVVTLDNGEKIWDVFVAGDNEIVKVGTSTDVLFDAQRVIEVRSQ